MQWLLGAKREQRDAFLILLLSPLRVPHLGTQFSPQKCVLTFEILYLTFGEIPLFFYRYMEKNVVHARSCSLGQQCVLGEGSSLGDAVQLQCSVLGRRCSVGADSACQSAADCCRWAALAVATPLAS